MIFCSGTSVCQCNIHSLIEKFATLSKKVIAALLQFSLVETFTAMFQHVRGSIVAAVSFTLTTQPFHLPALAFEETRLSLLCFFVLATAYVGEEVSGCISSETIRTVSSPPLLSFCFHFRSYSFPILSQQEQHTVNLCPFVTLRACLRQKIR